MMQYRTRTLPSGAHAHAVDIEELHAWARILPLQQSIAVTSLRRSTTFGMLSLNVGYAPVARADYDCLKKMVSPFCGAGN